jgi:hypothetical protein
MSYLEEKVAAQVQKPESTAVGIRCAGHVTQSSRKVGTNFADSGGRSVGLVRSRTQATELVFHATVHTLHFYFFKFLPMGS